jgi:riboflavin synthase
MFTGLVAAIGSVTTLDRDSARARIEFDSALATELEVGDSVAVNGVCLSATAVHGSSFSADIVAETLARTTLGELAVGSSVNLELPLRASDRLGGHVVLGHVDGVGEVRALRDDGELEVAIDPELARYVVEKGSIALDGVSLTVAAIEDRVLTVALIPQTLRATTLGALAPGGHVNVEVDVLAKHVEKLVAA